MLHYTRIILSLITIFVFGACTNPVKTELSNYVNNEVPRIDEQIIDILNNYNEVTGNNFRDDRTTYRVMKNDIIPKIKGLINDLENIQRKLTTSDVKRINDIAIEMINTEFNAFTLILAALEKQDMAVMTQANEKLASARKMQRNYCESLEELCGKYNISHKQ